MHQLSNVVWWCLAVGSLGWIAAFAAVIRMMRAVPVLTDLALPAPTAWPRVSLIVAALDEEASLEAAVRSRLDDDYPNLEVVLVDDRSTDATGAIADRLAASDARVRVIHVRELPDGWLGKLHAMHVGAAAATGEWLLFSDADVHFRAGALRRSIALCDARGVDHLSMLPEFEPAGVLRDAAFGCTLRGLAVLGRLWAVSDPASRAAVGGGLFNLVRRASFDRTAGFAWLKLEVADDVALGQMLKRSGARACVVNGRGLVSMRHYASLGEYWRGVEKNAFAVIGAFSFPRLLATLAVMLWFELAPFVAVALAPVAPPALTALAVVSVACALASAWLVARWMRARALGAMLVPLGALLTAWGMLRSGVLAVRRGGIVWRGTFYPTAMLRAGRRLEML